MQTMNAPAAANSVSPAVYRVSTEDDVAVALRDLAAQETIAVGDRSVLVTVAIPRGHKLAIRPVSAGQVVRKYGWPIGRATADIAVGSHVHSHNLETLLSGADEYEYGGSSAPAASKAISKGGSFLGYRRANGKVGTRNEIWILCTVGCVGRTAERIARLAAQKYAGRVDNVVAFPHQFGCSQLGGDLDRTRRLIAGLARHPNAGGVLILGLGCESNQLSKLLSEIPEAERARIRYFAAQATEDETEAGLQAVEELVQLAEKDRRVACGLDDLVVGLKCGGSDGFSGITANPLVGRIADRVTEAGGTAVLTEIPEIFGAEQLLMERAASREVFDGIVTIVNDFKEYFLRNNQPVHENPSPGNKAGGITTLEEKSLGAVQKGGHATVTQVLRYGERTTKPGLTLLEAPGNDGVSSTALVAAGATILLFTTGRGTPLGFPVPTLKISSNSVLAQHKAHWIDFDAGKALTAVDPETVTDEFLQLIVATASGQPARNELNEQREIAIWKDGVTL
ncbi:altronate hydrolase [Steroidobacter agaridevorans]|uniref:Altronate hydrolase n=1 Tax=Steroidobacter agaridevorans TaxID=2695856 RepID=A0A829Y812_9GAMM|nr:altronate dehydratase family protein [Steroidobacter agaridevorans]GFE78742.1 altronate hydrolase [Steroidobacter agaridevorans]GFE89325.1 altronate hydrolase [Steroidobacter agaridevorans]